MAAGSRLPHHSVWPAGVSFPGATWVPQGTLSRTTSCEGKGRSGTLRAGTELWRVLFNPSTELRGEEVSWMSPHPGRTGMLGGQSAQNQEITAEQPPSRNPRASWSPLPCPDQKDLEVGRRRD